ncbi:MAG TPA: hypothetical protein VGB66_02500 [Longimicrobium sp.]|jgi:hypothetical protein
MFERLDETTRVLDLRGILVAGSSYAAAGSLRRELEPTGTLQLAMIVGVYVATAAVFARRGGRDWIVPTAQHSILAVLTGCAWLAVQSWIADVLVQPLAADSGGMQFSIAEDCYGPDPLEVALSSLALGVALAMGSVAIGWVARGCFPLQEE